MDDRTREPAADRHQAVDPDEDEDASRGQARGGGQEVGDPLVRRELGGRGQDHAEDEDEEEGPSHRLVHPRRAHALLDALGGRELLAEEQRAVEDGRHQDEAHLHLPARVHHGEEVGHEAADDDPAREPHVEEVQLLRLAVGIDGGGQGVDEGFDQPVAQADAEGPREQHPESRREDREGDSQHVHEEREQGDPLHPQEVHELPADEDREGEAVGPGPGRLPQVFVAEGEGRPQVPQDVAADRERHRGGDQGHAAGHEQTATAGLRYGRVL